jgi:hypothetical protein
MAKSAGFFGILLCVTALARPTDASPSAPLPLAVAVQNNAEVSESELAAAKAQVSDIYEAIGVTIDWGTVSDRGFHLVIVRSAAAAHLGASDDALGLTPATLSGPGRRAYIFEDRARASFRELHMEFAALLGCAMAHELGHMLLPLHSHSETGIMRAAWDGAHLSVGTSDYLHFTPWQEKMIRQRLARR